MTYTIDYSRSNIVEREFSADVAQPNTDAIDQLLQRIQWLATTDAAAFGQIANPVKFDLDQLA